MKIRNIVNVAVGCLFVGILIFYGIYKYKVYRCHSSFGTELNGRRKEMHIPILPADWPMYNTEDYSTIWQAPKVKKGHGFKIVVYNDCELDLEEDHYYFSSKKLQDTVLTTEYRYINSFRKKDSTIFTFQIGGYVDTITSKQADSIFKANKIDKDY
jgi:hypothetical protein